MLCTVHNSDGTSSGGVIAQNNQGPIHVEVGFAMSAVPSTVVRMTLWGGPSGEYAI